MASTAVQIAAVQNHTQNHSSPNTPTNNNNILNFQNNLDNADIGVGFCKHSNTSIGFIVKHKIYRNHKFVPKDCILNFDNSPNSKSLCKSYLKAIEYGDCKDETTCRRAQDEARQFIAVTLNSQQANTTKVIRDTTFDSKC